MKVSHVPSFSNDDAERTLSSLKISIGSVHLPSTLSTLLCFITFWQSPNASTQSPLLLTTHFPGEQLWMGVSDI